MAYNAAFYRATFLFQVLGTDEIAATDLTFGPASGASVVAPTDADAEVLSDLFDTFLTNFGDGQRAVYSLYRSCKLAAVGTDGHYLSDPALYEKSASHAGTAPVVAPQCTVVVSLRSGSTLGKGNYGRMFIPHSGVPNSSQPTMEAVTAGAMADAASEFIGDVNSAVLSFATSSQVRIMSQAAPAGSNKPVAEVAVGRVIDTQRRRRNALEEGYAIRAV